MGEVVRLKRPRRMTIRGAARQALSEAMVQKKPVAVVVVALNADGTFSVRAVNDTAAIKDFDMYARAGAILDKAKAELLE